MRQQAPPNLLGQPSVEFRKDDFDATIWSKGYKVILEKALKCPCQVRGGSPKSDCNNCRGFGWIFVNPIETRASITSLNSSNKYRPWSLENANRANITVMDVNRMSFYDRITLVEDYSEISENLTVKKSSDSKDFVFPSYSIKEILVVFKFINSTTPLFQITTDQYTFDENKIIFNDGVVTTGNVISIRYVFQTQYNVLDVVHDIRSSKKKDRSGNVVNMKLPIMAVAQKPHTIQDRPNFTGNNVINNSWK